MNSELVADLQADFRGANRRYNGLLRAIGYLDSAIRDLQTIRYTHTVDALDKQRDYLRTELAAERAHKESLANRLDSIRLNSITGTPPRH